MLNIDITKFNRWQAFLIHLGMSTLIFLGLFLVIAYIWYPGVFLHFGGVEGIKIVAGVDFILGPVLTLIVFNTQKKNLRFDLLIILIFQLSCLTAGSWLVYKERPLTQILVNNQIYILTANDYDNYKVDITLLKGIDGRYPKKILLDMSDSKVNPDKTPEAGSDFDSTPIAFRTDLYLPFDRLKDTDVQKRLEQLEYNSANNCRIVEVFSYHLNTSRGCLNETKGLVYIE